MQKEGGILLELPSPPACDNWGRHKLNDYIVNNMHSASLQEIIHSEVCHIFRSTNIELFSYINVRKTDHFIQDKK